MDEAQTAAAVLGHNYPDSRWYKDAYTLLQTNGLEPREAGRPGFPRPSRPPCSDRAGVKTDPGRASGAMLQTLTIRDIVLIERLDIDFAPGLTVLTGETGAGKSILLDSLSLALGGRGDAGLVRHGAAQGR